MDMSHFDLKHCAGIVADSSDETIGFAAAELRRGLERASGLELADSGWRFRLETKSEKDDEFELTVASGDIIIRGANPRSVLFGVYTLLEEGLGVRYFHIGEETWPSHAVTQFVVPAQQSRPAVRIRGFMQEHVDDAALGVQIIDFTAKNRGNAVFVHFSDIETAGDTLITEARKRGLEFTVGGHSCTRFLTHDGKASGDQLYAERLQLCYSNDAIVGELCRNIAAYLRKHPGINRLSLWPSDSKNDCDCDKCRTTSFNYRYIRFMERLQSHLDSLGIAVQVEHIAYNAGLSEAMMGLPDFKPGESDKTDTLFAYWGRDYRKSMDEVETEPDRHGRKCVNDWAKHRNSQPGREFRMIEYYNDFWMMTKYFPFLAPVIGRDAKFFHEAGVSGVISLIVPGRYMDLKDSGYPWEWIMGVNSRAMCRALWQGGLDAEAFADDYLKCYYDNQAAAREIYRLVEELLPEVTSFNVPLFRLRFPDLWIRDNDKGEFAPDPWSSSLPQTPDEKRRDAFCMLAAGRFAELASRLEYLPELTGNGRKIKKYFQYLAGSFAALAFQLHAQEMMRRGPMGAKMTRFRGGR